MDTVPAFVPASNFAFVKVSLDSQSPCPLLTKWPVFVSCDVAREGGAESDQSWSIDPFKSKVITVRRSSALSTTKHPRTKGYFASKTIFPNFPSVLISNHLFLIQSFRFTSNVPKHFLSECPWAKRLTADVIGAFLIFFQPTMDYAILSRHPSAQGLDSIFWRFYLPFFRLLILRFPTVPNGCRFCLASDLNIRN